MTLHTTILDMQPIDPAVGGGRLRLLGLYHALGAGHQAHYVGTYDWRGQGYRKQQLTPTLLEELVPLTEAHFSAAEQLASELGGKGVIDTAFHTMGHLSPAYIQAAKEAASKADVVIFSHPWIYPLVLDVLRPEQLIVYDAHNVEGLLRTELLDDGSAGSEVAKGVVEVESAICRSADLILACSHEDREAFVSLYGVEPERIRLAPNGTFTRRILPSTKEAKHAACHKLEIEGEAVAFFLGSHYEPNVVAARFIVEVLAPSLPNVMFVIAGGVGDGLEDLSLPGNLRVTGLVSDEEKLLWLQAADIAINPMFGGSGTNIKMLDFMAAGLPIVSTETGARGIETSEKAFAIARADNFAQTIKSLLDNEDERVKLGGGARSQADRFYSWERLSDNLGQLLQRWAAHNKPGRPPPFFSVVVPTYERPQSLSSLAECLSCQTYRDFEVIIVDQSTEPWPDHAKDFGFDLHYIHTDRKGAVTARNTGAAIARGHVIAFTDDDCEPHTGWLAAAQQAFNTMDIVGLEGLITSDRIGDPKWRPVTNEGFEGIGFMTANLFVRSDIFQSLNGFDIMFEKPHFREDTDLGWRMQSIGKVPFSRQAWVYHPPHSREIYRESHAARSGFFINDALLMNKHPERYAGLLLREVQWAHNPHFWDQFLKGVSFHGVDIPEPVRAIMHDVAGINYMGLMQQEESTLPQALNGAASYPQKKIKHSIGRSLSWIARPLWRRIWARLENRIQPIDHRLDILECSMRSLEENYADVTAREKGRSGFIKPDG